MTSPDTKAIRAKAKMWHLPPGIADIILALCDALDALCDALDAERADNERLTMERDHFESEVKLRNRIPSMNNHVAGMQAEIEQVREAYERGLEDAARVAEVKPRKGGRPLSGPHHAGIRRGRSEAARLIRALKSNDTNGGHQ